MILRFTAYAVLVFLAFAMAACAGDDSISEAANQSEQQFEAAGMQDMRNDALFVAEAASANMLQVQLGDLAIENAVSPEVRDMAQEITSAQRLVMDDLQRVSEQGQFVLPSVLGRAHQKVYDDVSGETGIGFDLAYLRRTREEHRTILRRYEDMAENAKTMEVKQFASKQLPLLRQHLSKAEALEDRLGRI